MEAINVVLIALGAALQAGGFGVALFQAARARREQIPDTLSILTIAGQWLKSRAIRIRRHAEVRVRTLLAKVGIRWVQHASGTLSVSGGGNVAVRSVVIRKSKTLEERVELLETDLQELRPDLEVRIEDAVSEAEDRRRNELRGSVHWEEGGIVAGLFGVLLAALGALI